MLNESIRHMSQTGAEVTERKQSFLYIGHALARTKKCVALFKESYISENFNTAREFLFNNAYSEENCPALIIIDIPYNYKELNNFMSWLKQNCAANIPVIYNESAVPSHLIKQLSSLRLVDDIVKVENYCSRLHEKAKFLQKTKNYLNEPAVADQMDVHMSEIEMINTRIPFLKRVFDIVVASLAIIFFLPLYIIIAIAIRLESRGPVFYSAYRAGRGFRIFRFFKFRTMIPNADKLVNELADLNMYDGAENKEMSAFFKVKNDPRVTKVGAFLRNTSLDELPQFFNVLIGDMSIVGNRPLPLYEAAVLTTDQWAERFMAPAGITGLWQVTKRGQADMSTEERIALDIDYARNHSLKSDLMIILKTPTALFQKSNV